MTSTLVMTLSVLTTITNVALIFSPVPDLWRIHRQRDTGEMVVLPLVSMWINNHFWLLYGFGSDNYFPLVAISVLGELMAIISVAIYVRYTKERAYVAKAIGVSLLAMIPASLYVVLFYGGVVHQSDDSFKLTFGYLADIQNFFMYLAPLEKVKQVIVTKSAVSIPVLISSAIFANCSLWLSTGIATSDNFIIVPNTVGATLGAIQVTLFFVYRPKKHVLTAEVEASKIVLPVDLEMQTPSTGAGTYQPLASPLAPTRSN